MKLTEWLDEPKLKGIPFNPPGEKILPGNVTAVNPEQIAGYWQDAEGSHAVTASELYERMRYEGLRNSRDYDRFRNAIQADIASNMALSQTRSRLEVPPEQQASSDDGRSMFSLSSIYRMLTGVSD